MSARTLLAIVALLSAPGPRALADASCFGRADYGDELTVSGFQLVSRADAGAGLERVRIRADIQNLDVGDFDRGTAIPNLDAAGLGLTAEALVAPLEFGSIGPRASTASTVAMEVVLPSTEVSALLDGLEQGLVPLRVEAFETTHLAADVQVQPWRDTASWIPPSGLNFASQPIPWSDEPVIGKYFIVEDRSVFTPDNLPLDARNVRALAFIAPTNTGEPFAIDAVSVENEVMTEVVQSGSFCTTEAHLIDPIVQVTRLSTIDGVAIPGDVRDTQGQPIRFNDVALADGVTLSGQIGGHALRPSFELRVREGRYVLIVRLDTEIAMTAQLEARQSVSFEPAPQNLYSLCFPLPPITAGPFNIPLYLRLEHGVYAAGEATAGLTFGLSQRIESVTELRYDSGAPAGQRFQSSVERTPAELVITPPQLTDDTRLTLTAGTTLRASLLFSSDCTTGVGGYAELDAFASLDVVPAGDPWWSLRADARLSAGLEAQLFGMHVFEAAAPRPVPDSVAALEGDGQAEPGASSGRDQRWAVVVENLSQIGGLHHETEVAVDDSGNAYATSQGSRTNDNLLIALDSSGAARWNAGFVNGFQPVGPRLRRGQPEQLFVAGRSSQGPWLAALDSEDGEVSWAKRYQLRDPGDESQTCDAFDFEVVPEAQGGGFILAGRFSRPVITLRDGCALRLDDAGNVLWGAVYADDGAQYFLGTAPLADGGFALVGMTDFNLSAANMYHPLVVRVDAAGEIVWAKNAQSGVARGGFAEAVVEDEDGTLFWVGGSPRTIRQTGALFMGRIAGDGSDGRHALMLQDEEFESVLGGYIDTDGGDESQDAAYDIAKVAGGFAVVGRTGTEVTADSAAWAFLLNRSLGVEWLVTLDGPEADQFTGVAPSAEALYVAGTSRSFTPLGSGGAETSLVVAKLPYEGRISPRPETLGVARFLSPGVRATSESDEGIEEPLTRIAASVTVDDVSETLMRARDLVCVDQLTQTGRPSSGDDCTHDSDGDGVADGADVCPYLANTDQGDFDGDGRGDACDEDDDGDGVLDAADGCPRDGAQIAPGVCGCGVACPEDDPPGTESDAGLEQDTEDGGGPEGGTITPDDTDSSVGDDPCREPGALWLSPGRARRRPCDPPDRGAGRGGCSLGGSSTRANSWVVAIVVAVVTMRRRRRGSARSHTNHVG